jgi:methylthioribulose-1-phosphate dehydratase
LETSTVPTATSSPLSGLEPQIAALQECGHDFWRRGWSLGTSSNYSLVVARDPLELLLTASGRDKGRLGPEDFVRVGADGLPTSAGQPPASAETLLHLVAAGQPGVGAVLHTHSVAATVLSDLCAPAAGVELAGYEMLKGLTGVDSHQHAEWVPIFENTQDIPTLAAEVGVILSGTTGSRRVHGFLLRRHGLYTWGRDLAEARRQVEVFEFLFECALRSRGATAS